MNVIELNRALRQLRLGGMAAVLETRLHQAQAEPMPPIDFLSCLIADELQRRGDRLLERRKKQAAFRDPHKTLDNFDFDFNKKMNRSLAFDLAGGAFIARHEDALFLGPPGTGKSHLATALAVEAVKAGRSVVFSTLADIIASLAKAEREGTLRERIRYLSRAALLVVDEIGYLPVVPGGGNLFFQLVNARYEKGAMILTSNRGFAEWGEVFGDPVVATALLDRLLHHAVVIQILSLIHI